MQATRYTTTTVLALAAIALSTIAIVSPALAGTRTGQGSQAPVANSPSEAPNVITVHGVGRVTMVPDMATVIIGVDERAETAVAAQQKAAEKATTLLAAIKSFGIADADVATVNISLGPVYDYSTNVQKLIGYEAMQQLQVKVRKLADTGKFVDACVAAGATQIQSISLTLSDATAGNAQARAAAVADGKARADALAKAAGVGLGDIVNITESSYSSVAPIPYAAGAGAAADKASTPIAVGTTEVEVDVDMSFEIV
jgi:uncharacterized protein